MATPVRIAIIGAGSAQFSLGLVRDICLTEGLAGSTVCLMDISAERVAMVHKLATRYTQELGANLRFEQTTTREHALKDADFVLNTASVGAHGGGGFGEVHNLRFFVSVAQDMEKYCPHAWLIQSGNPVFEGCTAMTRDTSIKVLGLCHGHYGVYEMAAVLGLQDAHQHLSWQAPGFNHVIYLTHCYYQGQDVYPLLDDWIAHRAPEYWRTHQPQFWDNQMSRAAIQQYRMTGYLPIGDTPRAGGWWYHTDTATKQRWFGPLGGFDSEQGWALYVKGLEEGRQKMLAVVSDPRASILKEFPPQKSTEQIVPIIDALVNDRAGYFQVNIPNHHLIFGLPDDVVVEVPAFVSKRGIQGLQVGAMPQSVMVQVLLPRLAQAEAVISFARAPSRSGLLHRLLYRHAAWNANYSPPVAGFEEAEKEADRILADDPELAKLMR